MRALPALDLVRGFDAAARHLSFTKAATELFLTQSAISRQIGALEEQLGLKLVPQTGPVEVLVIDHVAQPKPN